MKKMLIAFALVLPTIGFAQDHLVNGYVKQDGTYVAPHMQTKPNNTRTDNYSTVGNTNPYTGVPGTKPLVAPTPSSDVTPKTSNPYDLNPKKP